MTDKQILIDGVDIKECAYFRYPLGCNSLDNKTCQCMNNDCDYKQLKRKEQECDELENLNTRLDNQRETYWKEYQKLRQALKEIKNIVETCNSGINCSECPHTEQCRTDIEAEALGVCNLILQKFEGLNDI